MTQDTKSWDIRGVLSWTVPYLKAKGIESARLDCELLLTKVLGLRRIDLYMQIDRPLSLSEQQQYGQLLRRRLKKEPMAYILGTREFMGHSFMVTPAVLIPRPETEILVEEALSFVRERLKAGATKLRVLDVGTGSGCIALSLAQAVPELELWCWDKSAEALKVAAENARQMRLSERLHFVEKDALDPASWSELGFYDLLVSNPPYIGQHEHAMLDRAALSFEPQDALFGGEIGLDFYHVMGASARQILAGAGRAFWEIGPEQKSAVEQILLDHGWQHIMSRSDYGSRDRVLSARP